MQSSQTFFWNPLPGHDQEQPRAQSTAVAKGHSKEGVTAPRGEIESKRRIDVGADRRKDRRRRILLLASSLNQTGLYLD